jgi:hypothetical protein
MNHIIVAWTTNELDTTDAAHKAQDRACRMTNVPPQLTAPITKAERSDRPVSRS